MLRAGETAPDFVLPDGNGQPVRLSDLRQPGGFIVLYFYPRDESFGCTREACAFRDQYAAFQERGGVIVGISRDSVESHRRFVAHHHLPFTLLSDSTGNVHRLYGVGHVLGLIPGRVTFVIDPHGTIRHVFSSSFRPHRHAREALRALGDAGRR